MTSPPRSRARHRPAGPWFVQQPAAGFVDRIAMVAMVVAAALGAASLAVGAPVALTAAVVPVVVVGTLALSGSRTLGRVAAAVLAGLLIGYMFLGRGFAHLGVGPVYVGEAAIALGVCAALMALRQIATVLARPALIAFICFALLGAARTAPFVSSAGVDALRDAALWYYLIVGVLVGWMIRTRSDIERVLTVLGRLLPWLLLWIPVAYLLDHAAPHLVPTVPGPDDTPIVGFKAGDMSVFVGIAMAMLLLFRDVPNILPARWPMPVIWTMCAIDFLMLATRNRGGLVAVSIGLAFVLALKPRLHVLQGFAALAVIVSLFLVLDVRISLPSGREVSIQQLSSNITSIANGTRASDGELAGTTSWRINFWTDIADDALLGDARWGGHGFGLNLADYYGYQPNADGSLRSPHNATMTVIARMGLPGLVLWIAANSIYFALLLRAWWRTRQWHDRFPSAVFALLAAHLVMVMLNSSFDPYLEGPQGGAWYYASIGMGSSALAVLTRRRAEHSDAGSGDAAIPRYIPPSNRDTLSAT